MEIEDIRGAFRFGQYRLRDHARRQMRDRIIEQREVVEAILSGEIIEEYPGHYYGPCCLIYGITSTGRRLHIVASLPPLLSVITAYEPDPEEWIDFRVRRL